MADEIDVYKEWLGIPEGDRPPDNYTLLRLVQFEDDKDKIQSNYRKLNAHVRKYATGQYLLQSQTLLNELAKAMLCLTDPDGKREYDESLGRAAPAESTDDPRTVLQYLVAHEHIKRSQVSEIEHFAEARGLSHRDAVIQMRLVEPADAVRALAAELRMSFVDLDDMLPEDDVLDRVPRRIVKRHACLPLFEDRGRLLVACADEPAHELEDEIRMRFGVPMRAVLAVPRSINQAIAKYYAAGLRNETADSVAQTSGSSKKPAKGEKGDTANKAKPAKQAPKSSGKLSDEERDKRMKISLIIIGWTIIGSIVGPNLAGVTLGLMNMVYAVVLGAIVAGILKLTYWK